MIVMQMREDDVRQVGGINVQAGKLVAQAMQGERTEFERLASLPVPSFPGGKALRYPTLVAAMSLYALRDRL